MNRLLLLTLLALCSCASTSTDAGEGLSRVRIASFNAYLNRPQEGQLLRELETSDSSQVQAVAEILQRVRPDIVLLCELDHDGTARAVELLQRNYLDRSWNGSEPIEYPHVFVAPCNTGVPSGVDLDGDGRTVTEVGERAYGNDCFGYGVFPGQYSMALLSRFPIDASAVRTFRELRWAELPGALLPDDPKTPEPGDWYSAEAREVLRLSSKSHWDVPIQVGERVVHALCAHPTPPGFDGEEDRNGRRNHDELRLWRDYLDGADYLVDDAGAAGGLGSGASCVVLGDLNADPLDGGSFPGAITQLLDHGRLQDPLPRSTGGGPAAIRQGGVNPSHSGDPALDTGDFGDVSRSYPAAGNLRVDYALPSSDLEVLDAGVFWPAPDEPLARLVEDPLRPGEVVSSDHRLVWVDVILP